CFVWEGPIQGAIAHLRERGVAIELGPVGRTGARGDSNSVYFRDPDDNELEVYCDNNPEEYIQMPNAYLGKEKLEFAQADKGLAEMLAEMQH
ncbi:MAG: hypothetical protein HY268_08090, partial [Deltaproteobacteria bacterium]|nr:hypothetical protein [Deltaproteobacteria bacterium]